MYNELLKLIEKPEMYFSTNIPFWDDEYISKNMLDAHLNPDFEAASRPPEFLDKSVKWISSVAPSDKYKSLLDIGCGPGLYCQRFVSEGYKPYGIDFSKRSINYAKDYAEKNKLDIRYLYQNYLTMDLNEQFDLCTLIYCDYGALSKDNRKIVLEKVHKHLKQGGLFILDSFTPNNTAEFKPYQTFNITEGGFWTADKCIELSGGYKYSDRVTLEMTSVVTEKSVNTYCIWDTSFTYDEFAKELSEGGFVIKSVYGDVAGAEFTEKSKIITAVCEKV